MEQVPDIIVLDLGLRETQGIETLQALDPTRLAAPVVVLTATADVDVSRNAIAHGAQDYVWKFDLSPGAVARAIENSIERFGLTRTLQTANTSLQAFTTAAAHDLDAPLRRIATALSALQDSLASGDTDRAREWIDDAAEMSHRLRDLVDQLANFARHGADALQRERCALRSLVMRALNNLAEKIRDTEADIEVELDPDSPAIFASPPLIVSVFQNLLDNALTYTQRTPRVRITLETSDTQHILTIEDNGVGIAKESLEEIFRPFRNDRSSEPNRRRSGVGLAVCDRIVRAHDGRIWAESDPPHGSRIRIAIPTGQP